VNRVAALVEKRHRIIHREYLETGWPATRDPLWRREFVKLCAEVSNECKALTVVFTTLLIDWMDRERSVKPTLPGRVWTRQAPVHGTPTGSRADEEAAGQSEAPRLELGRVIAAVTPAGVEAALVAETTG